MAFQVICLSAEDGSDGEQVGTLVAERLGYRVVDDEIVELAARQAHVDPAFVADVERRKSRLDRLLDRLAPAAVSASMGACPPPPVDDVPKDETLHGCIRTTIEHVADLGRVVILAHAASFALHHRPDTLRVFVTASRDSRAHRLATSIKELTKLDADRANYLKRFYQVCAEQPHHYDLVVNTDRLDPATAAGLIARMATA